MNKLLVALIAGAFATVAAAQTAAPAATPAPTKKEMNAQKAKEVGARDPQESRHQRHPAMAAEQKANTAKSKEIAKPTKAAEESRRQGRYGPGRHELHRWPETAAQAKKNTAVSKEVPKPNGRATESMTKRQLPRRRTRRRKQSASPIAERQGFAPCLFFCTGCQTNGACARKSRFLYTFEALPWTSARHRGCAWQTPLQSDTQGTFR